MSNNGNWQGFVNCELTKAEKAEVKKTEITEAGLADWLANLAAAGYKFTLSFDKQRDCYVATLTSWEEEGPNYGFSMSQRHSQFLTALRALWFAHEVKLEGNWASVPKQGQLRFDW